MLTNATTSLDLRRVSLAALLAAALALLAELRGVQASPLSDECPQDEAFDPYTDRCVVVVEIDCGPDPYLYNEVGGHWQRRFNRTCYPLTEDPFDGIFHHLNYAEAQARLAELGLAGLTHDQVVRALTERGVWDPVNGQVITDATKAGSGKRLVPTDCGPNPYRFNAIGGHYERAFSAFCYPVSDDLNDLLYSGLTLDQTPLAGA